MGCWFPAHRCPYRRRSSWPAGRSDRTQVHGHPDRFSVHLELGPDCVRNECYNAVHRSSSDRYATNHRSKQHSIVIRPDAKLNRIACLFMQNNRNFHRWLVRRDTNVYLRICGNVNSWPARHLLPVVPHHWHPACLHRRCGHDVGEIELRVRRGADFVCDRNAVRAGESHVAGEKCEKI